MNWVAVEAASSSKRTAPWQIGRGARRAGWRSGAVLLALVGMLAAADAWARGPEGFADLAERLLPSVVNISTTQVIEGRPGAEFPVLPPGSPFEEFFKEFFEKNQPHRRRRATSLGSGFIINGNGYVVTNNHVIQDADEINVILQDKTRLKAEVVGRDARTDLAVLQVKTSHPLVAVSFGDSDKIRVGDWVLAIGNPFGFGGTVTAGIISARGRDINAGPYDSFLQTDASINRGNSGGPMFSMDGRVIGINTAIYSPSGGSIGIGFAIPSNDARLVIKQLIEHGEVRRGWLGVRIQRVTEELADSFGLERAEGALVAEVLPDGPAARAGIKKGDVILEFAGKKVEEMRQLPRIVADTEVGKRVPVKIWRNGRETTITVEVGALKEGEEKMVAKSPGQPRGEKQMTIKAIGLTVARLDDKLREQYELDAETEGVVVTDVDPAGPAAGKGVREGDVIVEVNQEEVSTPADIAAKVKAARKEGRKSILLLIEGPGGLRFVAVRIEKR